MLNMFDAKPGLFILSKDVLWLKYLFFTSFRLSVYTGRYNESDAATIRVTTTIRVTITIRVTTTIESNNKLQSYQLLHN